MHTWYTSLALPSHAITNFPFGGHPPSCKTQMRHMCDNESLKLFNKSIDFDLLTYMFHDLFVGSFVCLFWHILEHFKNCLLMINGFLYFFQFFKKGAVVTTIGVTKPHMHDCTIFIHMCMYSSQSCQFHSFVFYGF